MIAEAPPPTTTRHTHRRTYLHTDTHNPQVLITYGQKSNAELLLLYGFVVDRNRFDQVELRVALSDDDPMCERAAAPVHTPAHIPAHTPANTRSLTRSHTRSHTFTHTTAHTPASLGTLRDTSLTTCAGTRRRRLSSARSG